MYLSLRWKLKALPIWKPDEFDLKSAISRFITISETSSTKTEVLEAALGKLSDYELDQYSYPMNIPSITRAVTFCVEKGTQSSRYHWKKQDDCLVLLSQSKFAEKSDLPGVIYEFIIRTSRSSWTVYRVPEPRELLDCAVYFERNELIRHSQPPSKLTISSERRRLRYRLALTLRAIALALSPMPVRKDSLNRCKESEDMAISGALP
jgi:hypothetical protein